MSLRQQRIRLKLTQAELANALLVSPELISSYENNKRYPSYPVLCRLENFFGVSHRYLFSMPSSDNNFPYT